MPLGHGVAMADGAVDAVALLPAIQEGLIQAQLGWQAVLLGHALQSLEQALQRALAVDLAAQLLA